MNRVTVITNVLNEEYCLPYWLKYHKNIFDHGIIIDWFSTDRSIQIIREICPTWEIRQTRNILNGKPNFETCTADMEIMDIENTVPGYKIFLNVTEFLIMNRPIKTILNFNTIKCYPLNVLTPINNAEGWTPPNTKDFIAGFHGKLIDVRTKRFFRYLFNRPNGQYLPGRHATHVPSDLNDINYKLPNYEPLTNNMCVIWTGFYPLTEQMWQRKLAVKTYMSKEIELARNFCFQHFWNLEEMKKDYKKLCETKPIDNFDLTWAVNTAVGLATP